MPPRRAAITWGAGDACSRSLRDADRRRSCVPARRATFDAGALAHARVAKRSLRTHGQDHPLPPRRRRRMDSEADPQRARSIHDCARAPRRRMTCTPFPSQSATTNGTGRKRYRLHIGSGSAILTVPHHQMRPGVRARMFKAHSAAGAFFSPAPRPCQRSRFGGRVGHRKVRRFPWTPVSHTHTVRL